MQKRWATVLVVSAVGLAACGGTGGGTKHTLTGTVASKYDFQQIVHNTPELEKYASASQSGVPCPTDTGLRTKSGDAVVVKDAAGKQVGQGRLKSGTFDTDGACVLAFTISDVADSNFYEIEVSGTPGTQHFTKQELEAASWAVKFTTG